MAKSKECLASLTIAKLANEVLPSNITNDLRFFALMVKIEREDLVDLLVYDEEL